MSQEAHLIVDRLREYKFEEDLTLVTFDEKSPLELLELLNNVLKHLSTDHNVDVRDEDPQDTAVRVIQFLAVLNYNTTVEFDAFKDGLREGDRSVIYPIFLHLLSNLPAMRKRAYLARFLTNVDLPEEMYADPEIQAKHAEYTQLQQAFKDTHKNTERLRGTTTAPTELKKEVAQLEEERQQLKQKINKMELKLKKLDNFEELYEGTSTLRKEQEEEARLGERMHEQQMMYKQAENRFYLARKKLAEMHSTVQDGTGEDLLTRLREDVNSKTMICMDKLPGDINAKQQRLDQVHEIIKAPPVNTNSLHEMQSEIQNLSDDIARLTDEDKSRQSQGGDKLSMFRQQALIVSRKKQDALERLQMRQEEQRELEQDLEEKQTKRGTKGVKVLKGAEFAKYAEGLKAKAKEHKKLKGMLSTIVSEKGILLKTEKILKTRHGDQSKFLEDLEKQKGVQGAVELQEKLEAVSEQTSNVNKAKEMTLEEISETVSKINTAIKEKKAKLAPLIKELRQVRADFAQLEADHNEKKAVYDNTKVGLDADKDKLSVEVTAYSEECRREESRFHYLNAMVHSTKTMLERATKEVAGRNKIGDMGQSYEELYKSRIQAEENQSKILRERQKNVKENHEGNVEQAKMFKSLQKLLGSKIRSLNAELSAETGENMLAGGGIGTNVMLMD